MEVKITDITAIIEEAAPLSIQESYDNSGLIVGHPETLVRSALVCVDITEEVLSEAEKLGTGMIISHHPIIFNPLKRLTGNNYVERVVERAIRKNIALYACHTNLDAAHKGMSYKVAEIIGLEDIEVLSRSFDCETGYGITGVLRESIPSLKFMAALKENLNLQVIRYSNICFVNIHKVAVCTGSGSSLIENAVESGAEIYISSDFKYHNFLDADRRIILADIGHFESEYCSIDLLYDIITKKLPTFAVHKSVNSRNPINYLV